MYADCVLPCFAFPIQSLGLCVCSEKFAGADCAILLDAGKIVWETLIDTQLTAVSGPPQAQALTLLWRSGSPSAFYHLLNSGRIWKPLPLSVVIQIPLPSC